MRGDALHRKNKSSPKLGDILEFLGQGKLTQRDLRALDAVYDAGGVMMTHQIADVVFHNLSPGRSRMVKTRQRLRRLFEYHLLGRKAPLDLKDNDALDQVSMLHFLGPSSTSVLASRRGIPIHKVNRAQQVAQRLLNHRRLLHDLLAVDVWVAFAQAGQRHGWPVSWQGPREAYTRVTDERGRTKKAYAPDGLVTVSIDGTAYRFFVEMDTGTESRRMFVQSKFVGLKAVHRSGTFQKRHGAFPELLIVTRTPERADSLSAFLAELGARDTSVRYLLAPIAAVRSGVERITWRRPGWPDERLW